MSDRENDAPPTDNSSAEECDPQARLSALIKRTRQELLNAEINEYARVETGGPGCLDIAVAPANIERALAIYHSLGSELLKHGVAIEVIEESQPGLYFKRNRTYAIVGVDKVPIKMEERSSRRYLKLNELPRLTYPFQDFVYEPNGELAIRILGLFQAKGRQRWSDTKIQTLEKRIHSIADGVIAASAYFRNKRIQEEDNKRRYEEEKRKEAELEHLRRLQNYRLEKLSAQLDMVSHTERARAFLTQVETYCSKIKNRVALSEDALNWLEWLRTYVGSLDPIGDFIKTPEKFVPERYCL